MSGLTRKEKKALARILAAGVLLIAVSIWKPTGYVALAAYLVPYAIVGWDVLWKAVRNIAHGQVFDENFLMALATVGALVLGEYAEAVGVMLFYQVGELFQTHAVGKSRQSIAQLMDIRPDEASVLREGKFVTVDPEEVAVGDVIQVKPGEKVPLDGRVLTGTSTLDTAALTGESVPRGVKEGDEIVSGCVNLTGLITVEVTKPFGESTVAKILELVENAASKKAAAENFITRFARVYTPAVVIGAVCLALIPPLFVGGWAGWIRRALIFLVISCPCALVISIPLAFFGGIGGASRRGILVKGGNYLEKLAKVEIAVFDKTGTLTKGVFQVSQVCPADGVTEEELLEQAALAEQYSGHPIAQSLLLAYGRPADPARTGEVSETAGQGLTAQVDGRSVAVGSARLMAAAGIEAPACADGGTVVHVARDGAYLGRIVISDQVKPSAPGAIAALKARGIRTVMLTGDTEAVGRSVGQALGMDQVYAQLLPGDKVDHVEQLLTQRSAKGALAYVGDGVNDAPVLSRADVGVAMGAMGSDAALEAADVVLMDDDLGKLALAMDVAKKCSRIVTENIVFALGVKGLFLLLGALGMANMWEAVFADVGVAVIAILNAGRMLRTK